MTAVQLALLADSRLSDAARIIGLHISMLPDGEHELPYDGLAILLHGTPNNDTVGRHIRQLTAFGYIEKTSGGGKGSPRFRWVARENSRPETAMPAKNHGENAPPTTTTETTTTPPVSPSDGLELVREYLGDEAVDTALSSTVLPPVKLKGLLGLYGPRGMETERVLGGLSPPERRRVLSTAVTRFAMDAKNYNNRLFETYLTRARDGKDGDSDRSSTGERRGDPGRSRAAPRAVGAGAGRGQDFIIE